MFSLNHCLFSSLLQDSSKGESRRKTLIQQQSCSGSHPQQHRVRFTLDTDIDQHLTGEQQEEDLYCTGVSPSRAVYDAGEDDAFAPSQPADLPSQPHRLEGWKSGAELMRPPSDTSSTGSFGSGGREFTPIQEVVGASELAEMDHDISIRVPERVTWYLPNDDEKETTKDGKARVKKESEYILPDMTNAKVENSRVRKQGFVSSLRSGEENLASDTQGGLPDCHDCFQDFLHSYSCSSVIFSRMTVL